MIGRLKIEMSRNSMSVSGHILPQGNTEITETYVMEELEARAIKAGISANAIKTLVESGLYGRSFVLASGKPAKRGKDGYYEFLFDKDAKEYLPTIREDGSVDYAPHITMVQKGDKLVIYHPPVQGVCGYTVFGSVVAPPPLRAGEHIRCRCVEKRENIYYAQVTGRVTFHAGELEVRDYLNVNGNAGYGTGMINFNGDVHVLGDILSDVVMNVDGNLEVDGVIEGAKVTVGKDIVVRHGIHGKEKAVITAGGTITANFIEAATIHAGRDIVAGHMINTIAFAEESVTVAGKNGMIIGGKISAGESITASYIGNDKGYHTFLKIAGKDIWSQEYARVVILQQMHLGCSIDINGSKLNNCALPSGELHATQRGIERFEIGAYEYGDVEKKFKQEVIGHEVGEKPLILLVDDDPLFLKTQYSYLATDYRVAAVSSSGDALHFLEKHCPDLILLDYLMPEMNGGELLNKIRTLPVEAYANIPVLFLTSVTDKSIIVQCLKLYPQGYLIKPLSKEELLKAVGDFFSRGVTAE